MSRPTPTDKRLAYLLGELTVPPPKDLSIGTVAAWAAEQLPATGEGASTIDSLVSSSAWRSTAAALEAALPDLIQCADRVPDPASLWRHVVKNLQHVEVHRRLARLLREHGPVAARQHADAAIRKGADEADLVWLAVAGSILTARYTRARGLLRAHPGLPDHAALLHLASGDAPLPEPLCGCAGHPQRSPEAPPSDWLKVFFSEGDSLYDAENVLCLSCHTFWQRADEHITPFWKGWTRQRPERYRSPQGWQLGMDDASPGDAVLSDPAGFIRWIRSLEEGVASYGML